MEEEERKREEGSKLDTVVTRTKVVVKEGDYDRSTKKEHSREWREAG